MGLMYLQLAHIKSFFWKTMTDLPNICNAMATDGLATAGALFYKNIAAAALDGIGKYHWIWHKLIWIINNWFTIIVARSADIM